MSNSGTGLDLDQFKPITSSQFYSIANYLLNSVHLVINNKSYRINEIEFYLTNSGHNDPYSHCHEDQLSFGYWYFHRYHNGIYKGGTYKGMDLTLGNNPDSYCGVLIRAISPIIINESGREIYPHKKSVVNGPCRTVNHILDQLGYSDIPSLTGCELLDVSNNRCNLILEEDKTLIPEIMYQGWRIGLNDSKCPEFRNRLYRYIIRPEYLSQKDRDSLVVATKGKPKVDMIDD